MEVEFSFPKDGRTPALLILALLVLLGLGALGRAVTPAGDRLLTWDEWRLLQARQAYQRELAALRGDAERLAGLLAESPDPVRAQLLCERVLSETGSGQAALSLQREAVALAAQALRDWAAGAGERSAAEAALEAAVRRLAEAEAP